VPPELRKSEPIRRLHSVRQSDRHHPTADEEEEPLRLG
jgi:hypothetical protein